ncbi:MAG: DUF805 domain-containing protein [Pseudomonadales bacterium]|nr:DUF805 domain-containing protein [Pseudomonadales bacterium]
MKVNSKLVKELRLNKQWSQTQLAEACGLNLRTIQRLENSGSASFESVSALAAVFDINANELVVAANVNVDTPFESVKTCLFKYGNFSDKASKSEYWWFFVFLLIVVAIAKLLNETLFQIIGILALLPFIAVGHRRLKDTGESGWWQLLLLVPYGQVVVFYLLAQDAKCKSTRIETS